MSENKYGEPFRVIPSDGVPSRVNNLSGVYYAVYDGPTPMAACGLEHEANYIADSLNACKNLTQEEKRAMRSLWEKREEIRGKLETVLFGLGCNDQEIITDGDIESMRRLLTEALSLIGGEAMKLSELVEAKAREAAEKSWAADWWDEQDADHFCECYDKFSDLVAKEIRSAIIATLQKCGFREALDLVHRNRFLCQNCRRSIWDGKCNEISPCTCPCHTAEAKLKELEEMSK